MTSSHRLSGLLLLLLLLLALSACATAPSGSLAPTGTPRFLPELYLPDGQTRAPDIDLWIQDREVVQGTLGQSLLRVRFSFVSYDGYVAEEDVHRSTGVVYFPVDASGEAKPVRYGEVLLTEFPPGSSVSGFPFYPEYGERPAIELGVPAAVVDVRGPIIRELSLFENPQDPGGAPFTSEAQLGYTMLRAYHESADFTLLYEHRIGEAWLRALQAVDEIVATEVDAGRSRFLLVGEGYGALGAVQAAAVDPAVSGLVLCGWPLDWADLHFTRWRRWERQARYEPLAKLHPIPYRDSQELLSFLFSSFSNPDPGCPSCRGGGDAWRAQFNYLDLEKAGALEGVRTLAIFGDSDPELPIDLEIRASAPAAEIATFPGSRPGTYWVGGELVEARFAGPFSDTYRLPFHGLRYLRESTSTLSNPEAAGSVLAWIQHLAGYRDLPVVEIRETTEQGNLVLDVRVQEGNTAVTGIEVYLAEITDRRDSDFKHRTHLEKPESMVWRRFDAIYSGHGKGFVGRWKAYLPRDDTQNRAYYVLVRDRVGNLESTHSLPIRPFWNLGDPAVGRARF